MSTRLSPFEIRATFMAISGGKVVAHIMYFIERADQFVPANVEYFVGSAQSADTRRVYARSAISY